MNPTKQSRPQVQDLRERILGALLQLVIERGVHKIDVTKLALRAGVSPSSFFRIFGKTDDLWDQFWCWCWKQLNSYIAYQLFSDLPETNSSVEGQGSRSERALVRFCDYLWNLREDETTEAIAFLCFLYYRRGNELSLSGEMGEEQKRFERRILGLCEAVVREAESVAQPELLQVSVMNWCAAVLMTWQFAPSLCEHFGPNHARIGLKNMIRETLAEPHVAA